MKYQWLLFLIIPIPGIAGDLFISNIPNGCSSDLNNYLTPVFIPNQYQCNPGYYVPANHDGCVICPEYYDCDGGTYTFNENFDQGNTFKTRVTENIRNGCRSDFLMPINNVSDMIATFVPNVHTCSDGYYLPANIDGCRPCLNNHYCPGGTYTFNENIDQGIMSCPNNLSAPTGMWESAQCGRIFHVGNDALYLRQTRQTEHTLNVKIGDVIYYGNMTTANVPMNINTDRMFKVKFNNTTYSVYDDTITP